MTVGTGDYVEFPVLEERLGENPAVWLESSEKEDTALAMIRGIQTVERARAWRAVERRLANLFDEEPRESILEALDEAEERAPFGTIEELANYRSMLEDQGLVEAARERADAAERQREAEEEPTVWRHASCGSTEVERLSRIAFFCNGCDMQVPTNRVEEVEAEEVAA